MNREAYEKTIELKKVTFYSRTRKCIWTKGETSGNYLNLVSMRADCDSDTLLIKVNPVGPVCHTGSDTCWKEINVSEYDFISKFDAQTKHDRMVQPDEETKRACASLLNDFLTKIRSKGLTLREIDQFLASDK